MLIRSQNKSILINMDNVSSITMDHRVKGSIKVFEGGADMQGYEIARYSTDKKAIKVLDMIQEQYGDTRYGCYQKEAAVFQMLADDEVEV